MLNAVLEIFSCVYSEIMFTIISFFQKLIKGGGVEKEREGWTIFQKLISGGGEDDYSVLKSNQMKSSQKAS